MAKCEATSRPGFWDRAPIGCSLVWENKNGFWQQKNVRIVEVCGI